MENFESAPQMEKDRLQNGLFEFDASNFIVVDEINEQTETTRKTTTIHNVSSDDDDIQFIEEVKSSSFTETRKRNLDESSSSTESKRQKVNGNGDGRGNQEVEHNVVEEVSVQEYEEYSIREPGGNSPDINEDEIHVLYEVGSETHKTEVRNTREDLQSMPTLNKKVWRKIKAYREKYPKKFAHFDNQILKHYERNIQNDVTFAWKMHMRNKILMVIREIYHDAELFVVGSTINGCGSFNADMDLCCAIEHTDYPINERKFAMKALTKIRGQLFRNKTQQLGMNSCIVIPAKVPILRATFSHPNGDLEVDLNVNNLAGVYNSYLLHYYSRIDDRFPALCLLVKHWAKKNSIGDAMNGMLNSYSIILLVIHFLQSAVSPPILPNLQKCYPDMFTEHRQLSECFLFQDLERNYSDPSLNKGSPGELLIAFFEYYSTFDFDNWAISIAEARVFSRDELAMNTERFRIFIEEPFDKKNTARCVTSDINFDIIKQTFKTASDWFMGKRRPDIKHIGVSEVFSFDN